MIGGVWLAAALAHTPGLSFAEIERDRITLTFSATELERYVAIGDAGAIPRIAAMTLGRAVVRSDGGACPMGAAEVARVAKDGIAVTAPLSCPPGDGWTLDAAYLSTLGSTHRQTVSAFGVPVGVVETAAPTITIDGRPRAGAVFRRFGTLGVEHILTGYDHLAFVAALVFGAASWRSALALVTTFTVAHSLTLAAAALGWVAVAPEIVEPVIAASIVLVALENLVRPPLGRRAALTFVFGLVHGLGFAGLLGELGLPTAHLLEALVGFNLGVEAGQAAVVAAGLVVLAPLRRWPWVTTVGSLGLAAAGLFWLVERLSG